MDKSIFENLGKLSTQLHGFQDKLAKERVVGEAGAGAVKIILNGTFEVESVEIDPDYMDGIDDKTSNNREVLQDLLVAAFHDAIRRLKERTAKINLPFDIFKS